MRLFIYIGLCSLLFEATAVAWQGFDIVDKEYVAVKDSEIPKTPISMPPLQSQDSVGNCFAFPVADVIDHANCVTAKLANCADMPEKDRVSVLDLSRFSKKLPEDEDSTDRFNYEGLDVGGGTPAVVLNNAMKTGQIIRATCAPFDQFVSKISNPAEAGKVELAMWDKFKTSYDEYSSLKKKNGQAAADKYAKAKSKELAQSCGLETPQSEILKAFAEETYDKFLDKALVPDKCWNSTNQTSLHGDWKLDIFPRNDEPKSNYPDTLKKLQEQLAKGMPVMVEMCAEELLKTKSKKKPVAAKSRKECAKERDNIVGGNHAMVITGYSKACDQQGNCVDRVKVRNSWGASWQKNYTDDGWVDAKVLLDRTFYEPQTLTWIEPKND